MTFLKTRNKSDKQPQRSCVACRLRSNKDDFIRIVIDSYGDTVIDIAKKLPGRGAYICPSSECLKRSKKGRLAGALKNTIKNADFWDKLETVINERSNAIER